MKISSSANFSTDLNVKKSVRSWRLFNHNSAWKDVHLTLHSGSLDGINACLEQKYITEKSEKKILEYTSKSSYMMWYYNIITSWHFWIQSTRPIAAELFSLKLLVCTAYWQVSVMSTDWNTMLVWYHGLKFLKLKILVCFWKLSVCLC